MKTISRDLSRNKAFLRTLLPAEDIQYYDFVAGDGTDCTVVYADGMADKRMIGDLVARPLLSFRGEKSVEKIKKTLTMPESTAQKEWSAVTKQILSGNAVLFVDGMKGAIGLGVKSPPSRAVAEPPTDVTVKGPRAGFIEELKINMVLLRARLKTKNLRFVQLTAGKQSGTQVALCYLDGIARTETVERLKEKIESIDIDSVADASYIADCIAERRYSLFRQAGTCEKPDILAAKMLEGRIGILVDGSPIALTVPYLLVEDFQAGDDYFVSPYRATFTRFIRLFSVLLSVYLPAFYVAAQLFKLQLLPLGLLLNVAGSIERISLSPSLEMFFTLAVLEVLTEASVRMPKYVGLALSVVGALVLGDTAVSAGFFSTPAILIIALSGICLYTVPDLIETTSILRLVMLLAAGSLGSFGILLTTAFLLYYLFSAESYGVPLLAPFSPVTPHDLKDGFLKYNLRQLYERPTLLRGKNKVRANHGK